jgi:hypothetical protein
MNGVKEMVKELLNLLVEVTPKEFERKQVAYMVENQLHVAYISI